MNNYEKRKFLDYMYKLLPELDFCTYTFDDVFEFFVKEFRVDIKRFSTNEKGVLIFESSKSHKEFMATMKKVVRELKEKIPPKDTVLEKQLLAIKDIYLLDNDEYEIMQFLVLKEINNIFECFYDSLKNSSLTTFTRSYLKIRVGRKDRIMENLYLKSIIDGRRSDTVNSNLVKVFDDPRINTQEKIVGAIVGKPEKTSLTLADYRHLKDEPKKVIKILSSAIEKKSKGINILLYGGVGTGKTEFAKLVAHSAKIPIYSVITKNDDFTEPDREDRLVNLYSKLHLLSRTEKSCVLFDEGEDVMNRGFTQFGKASKGYMNTLLEGADVPVIWTTNDIYHVDPAFLRRMTYCVEFEKLSEETRFDIWNKVIKKNKLKVSRKKVEELNKNYNIPPSLIANAVKTTKMIDGDENDFESMIENVAKVVTKKKNVKNKKEFEMKEYDESLVNTDYNISTLTEKINKCKRLNFSLCLYGEPGTGKSLYARYLAKNLGIEVLLKRASDLISPFVGQTEQNIAEAFAEAKAQKAMLIFDEADSFLQNRNNAQRSWEVSQVNEMLTWMESHEYPFVCTTNLLDTLDEASLRRFTFKIKFDFLTIEQVNHALENFFGIKDANLNIKGLTAGDFSTVKKKVDFLGVSDIKEIERMLEEEVKVKKSKELQATVGF
jgi:SpoVK/Ycf46/Vps4 family AAA+-type ATPase